MKLRSIVVLALVGCILSQQLGTTTSGTYSLTSNNTYNCVDSIILVCSPCLTYKQVVYTFSTDSQRLKVENTCTNCQTGTSKGAVSVEYYRNGTLISNSFITSGSQLCNPPSGQVTMSGYTPSGIEVLATCTGGNGTVCGICTAYGAQYYKKATYGSTDMRISYRCTQCTGGKNPRGTQVFQTMGSGVNVTTNWNVGDKTCRGFVYLISLAAICFYGLF